MILFAHHVELSDVPILAVFFAVGIWLGWHVTTLVCKRPRKTQETGVPDQAIRAGNPPG